MLEPAKTLIVARERVRRSFLVVVFSRSNKTILRVIPVRGGMERRPRTKSERRAPAEYQNPVVVVVVVVDDDNDDPLASADLLKCRYSPGYEYQLAETPHQLAVRYNRTRYTYSRLVKGCETFP